MNQHRPSEPDVKIDEVIVRVTIIASVPTYTCDEHENMTEVVYQSAVDQITNAITMHADAYILGYTSDRLTLKVAD